MKEMGQIEFINDFLRGQQDRKEGKPCEGGSYAYQRGYGAEYEAEQVKDFYTSTQRGKTNVRCK